MSEFVRKVERIRHYKFAKSVIYRELLSLFEQHDVWSPEDYDAAYESVLDVAFRQTVMRGMTFTIPKYLAMLLHAIGKPFPVKYHAQLLSQYPSYMMCSGVEFLDVMGDAFIDYILNSGVNAERIIYNIGQSNFIELTDEYCERIMYRETRLKLIGVLP